MLLGIIFRRSRARMLNLAWNKDFKYHLMCDSSQQTLKKLRKTYNLGIIVFIFVILR